MREGIGEKKAQSGLKARLKSFAYAASGIFVLVRTQANAKIHLAATVLVIIAGFWLHVSPQDWALLVIAMVSVWVAEGINTAIEALVDLVSPEVHPIAGKIKDVAAGAVLIAAIGAAIVGLIIFVPPLRSLIFS